MKKTTIYLYFFTGEPMLFSYGDCHTPHPKNQYCKSFISQDYFISYFDTPFVYEQEGVMHPGDPGQLLIITPGMPIYHGPISADTSFVNTWAYVHRPGLDALLEKYPLPLNVAFSAGPGSTLEQYVEQAIKEVSVKHTGYEDKLASLTVQLVIDLYRLYCLEPGRAGHLVQLREQILRQPEKAWDLKEMAENCGYSVSRFSALYKKRFGTSPKQDVLGARIHLASKMLIYTGASVTEIAALCGFQNVYYFSKYFKESTGFSPKAYIAHHQKTALE